MQVKMILQEIQRLPLNERFLVVQQTLKSIEKEKKLVLDNKNELFANIIVNEKSLASEWLSAEDNRWDKFLE